MAEYPTAYWKKHPHTGAWLVLAPGCKSGDVVLVTAKKTGTVKKLKLAHPVDDMANCFGFITLGTVSKGSPSPGYTPVAAKGPFKSMVGGVAAKYAAKTMVQAVAKKAPSAPPAPVCRTQKARGVLTLASAGWNVPKHTVLDATLALPESMPLPAFARPCPTQPRHGFVESRRVESIADVEIVRQETLAGDPAGEILLMPQLDGNWSAILTPAAISIGPGHDAATAGHGAATNVMLANAAFPPALLTQAGVGEQDMPYCELVSHHGETFAVQLRSGPQVPRTKNSIPKVTPVVTIIDARPYTDLEAWEKIAAGIDPSNTVVIAADLLCHQAAHCTHPDRNIAVITDGRELQPGMILKPEPLPSVDVQAFWEGLHYALPPYSAGGNWHDADHLVLALLALHHKAFMPTTGPGARLSGAAMRGALAISAVACHGEARHRIEKGIARHQIFADRYADADADVHFLEEVFNRPIWGSAFGGKNWAKCTAATVKLRNAVRACLAAPSESAVAACYDGLNAVVNVSHNGGLFLTKFGSSVYFDKAAQADAKWLAQRAASAVWRGLTESITLPCAKNLKHLRTEDPKNKPKVVRTFAVRARMVDPTHIRLQIVLTPGSYEEKTIPMTAGFLVAWDKAKDNAVLGSLAGTDAKYVPGFIRGRTLYLKQKAGWYITTKIELPANWCPPTKKAKKASAIGTVVETPLTDDLTDPPEED